MIEIEMMKTIDVSTLPPSFGERVGKLVEPVALMKGRKPIAVIVPVDEHADLESVSVGFNPQFQALMERTTRSLYKHGGISHEEILREFGLAPTNGKKVKTKAPTSKLKRVRKP